MLTSEIFAEEFVKALEEEGIEITRTFSQSRNKYKDPQDIEYFSVIFPEQQRDSYNQKLVLLEIPVEENTGYQTGQKMAEYLKSYFHTISEMRKKAESLPHLIERSAVVAAAGHIQDINILMQLLTPSNPTIRAKTYPFNNDKRKEYDRMISTVGINLKVYNSDVEKDSLFFRNIRRSTEIYSVRDFDKTEIYAPNPFKWQRRTLILKDVPLLPETVLMQAAGHLAEDVIEDKRLKGSGLVIKKMWASAQKEEFIKIEMKNDILSLEQARSLAERLIG